MWPIDEAGVSIRTHSRQNAWAPRGRRTARLPRALDASRITVLPAVSLSGLVAVIAQEGTVCRLDLEYFLEEVLVCVLFGLAIFSACNVNTNYNIYSLASKHEQLPGAR